MAAYLPHKKGFSGYVSFFAPSLISTLTYYVLHAGQPFCWSSVSYYSSVHYQLILTNSRKGLVSPLGGITSWNILSSHLIMQANPMFLLFDAVLSNLIPLIQINAAGYYIPNHKTVRIWHCWPLCPTLYLFIKCCYSVRSVWPPLVFECLTQFIHASYWTSHVHMAIWMTWVTYFQLFPSSLGRLTNHARAAFSSH